MTGGCGILDAVLLEPELEQLLGQLVEASRQVADRSERVFEQFILQQGTFISGRGLGQGGTPVEDDDIPVLEQAGFVRVVSRGRNLVRFRVTPEGEAHYEGRTGSAERPAAGEVEDRRSTVVEATASSDPGLAARAGNLAAYRKSSDLPSEG